MLPRLFRGGHTPIFSFSPILFNLFFQFDWLIKTSGLSHGSLFASRAAHWVDHQWNAEWADSPTRFRIFIPDTGTQPPKWPSQEEPGSGQPVARFQYLVGHNIFLGGQDFYFCYMFKTNFSGCNKIWGAQKEFGGHCLRMPPRGYGPGSGLTASALVSGVSAPACTNGAWPPVRPVSVAQKNKPSTMLSSNVQSIDLFMDCTAWRFWTMRQSNGCSATAPRSSAAKQWLE